MSEQRSLLAVAREILEGGPSGLGALPDPAGLAAEQGIARRQVLDELRPELYAVCSLLADSVIDRALYARPSFPPYGLARSLYSQMKMLSADPDPFPSGSIETFMQLGMAYQDTMVFHLHTYLREARLAGDDWLVRRLDALLALFRAKADPSMKARMRDPVSFLYGGLQFGVSVCVQLVEVMRTALLDEGDLPPDEVATILSRSLRPANRLAALNVEEVVSAYQWLHTPEPEAKGWMQPSRFAAREGPDGLLRVDVADSLTDPLPERSSTSYTTLGCPARVSASGDRPAIVELWSWCVELADELGLLERSARTA